MSSEEIQNPVVRQNLAVMCQAIINLDLGLERKASIDFFCDLKTGEILYTPSMIPPHEMAILIITLDIDHQVMSWETKERAKLLSKAEAQLQEMADILKRVFPKIEKLSQLAHFHWRGPLEHQEGNSLLEQTWHDVSREEAERLLLKQPVGTFLFRKDHFASNLQGTLSKQLKKTIHCYTLSYLDAEGIVRDKTVICINHMWTFYDDDPALSAPKFRKVEKLLQSLECALHPLYNRRVA